MVRKGSTTKKSASRKSLKKSSSRSHSHASHHTTNSNGFKMFAHCLVCRCKVNINNCKYVMVKGKGSKMRTRIEGVCEKGHKFAQFAKSSGGKSSSKTMKGGASLAACLEKKCVAGDNLSRQLRIFEDFKSEHHGFNDPGNPNMADLLLYNKYIVLLNNLTVAKNNFEVAKDDYELLSKDGD